MNFKCGGWAPVGSGSGSGSTHRLPNSPSPIGHTATFRRRFSRPSHRPLLLPRPIRRTSLPTPSIAPLDPPHRPPSLFGRRPSRLAPPAAPLSFAAAPLSFAAAPLSFAAAPLSLGLVLPVTFWATKLILEFLGLGFRV